MRNIKIIACTALLVSIFGAGLAAAGDKVLYDSKSKPNVPIQNLNALAPTKAKLRCDTTALTKAPFKGYSTQGHLGNEAQVVDATGAAVRVKWYLDGVLAWIDSVFSFTNPAGTAYTNLSFAPYSAASRNLTSCVKRQ